MDVTHTGYEYILIYRRKAIKNLELPIVPHHPAGVDFSYVYCTFYEGLYGGSFLVVYLRRYLRYAGWLDFIHEHNLEM